MDNRQYRKLSSYDTVENPEGQDLIPTIHTTEDGKKVNRNIPFSTLKGDPGLPGALNIGEVESGEVASATITGEPPLQILDLVLPKGEKGDKGDTGTTDYNELDNTPDLSVYANASDVTSQLDTKVDKAPGKQLSDQNYTQDEKNKLAGIEAGATANRSDSVVDGLLSAKATRLNIPQWTTPIRSASGVGEVQDYRLLSDGVGNNTIALRDTNGRLKGATAVGATDLVPKAQMDALVPIYGTGFPNGVVSAPVGSTYIDRNATNGAVEWKKVLGAGNTGWIVSVGDTDWLDITDLAPADSVASGAFDIRRKNDTVFLRLRNLANNTAGAVLIEDFRGTIGRGFEPGENIDVISRVNGSGVVTLKFLVQPASLVQGIVRSDPGTATYSATSWACVTAWPSSLPGA